MSRGVGPAAGRLTGKTALITGAGGGIGEATAEVFLEQGASVALVDANAEDLETVRRTLAETGGRPEAVLAVPTDITDEDDVRRCVGAVVDRFSGLDVLVNVAGVRVPPGDVTELPLESWRRVMEVNVFGSVLCSKYAVPVMAAGGGGSVIHLASVAAHDGRSGWAPYDSSKAALLALTRDMACDHVGQGIRVNVVSPGPTLTKFHVRNLARAENLTLEEAERRLQERGASCLMNRQADPREIAYALLFLASDEASFVTGSVLNVDGGRPDAGTAVPPPA